MAAGDFPATRIDIFHDHSHAKKGNKKPLPGFVLMACALRRRCAFRADAILRPNAFEGLDAEALVARIATGGMAIRIAADGLMTASIDELLVIAHIYDDLDCGVSG